MKPKIFFTVDGSVAVVFRGPTRVERLLAYLRKQAGK